MHGRNPKRVAALFFVSVLLPLSMMNSTVHPATRLVAWLALLVAVQSLSGAGLLVVVLMAPLLGRRVMRRGGRLIWRTRWLLASLLAVFAWGIAGEPLWNSAWAPTVEGVDEATKHLGRMLLVLTFVAAFLEYMPLADLLSASHALLRPFRWLGVDSDRGVVRLMLVLRYVETLPRPRDWRSLLDSQDSLACEVIEINHQVIGCSDRLIMFGLIGAVFMWLIR